MIQNENLEQVIKGCKNGDSESFSKLVDLYSARCFGYFYRLSGNRTVSDDLLSELFVKLVGKIGSFHGTSFDSWLFKVASNIFYDHLRSRQRREKMLEEHKRQLDDEIIPAKHAEKELSDKLQTQLEKIDPDTRELIIMRFYSELSFKELAKLRGEPIGSTLSKLHRGLKKLRGFMEQ
jgi:RNA polymerase sigma-70 factor, ECF subfamily